MKETTVPAGQSVVVVKRQFSSVPMQYYFIARPTVEAADLRGRIEITRRNNFGKRSTEELALQAENVVAAGLWDTFVTVTVHAEADLIISRKSLPGRSMLPILLIALGIAAIACLIFFLTLP